MRARIKICGLRSERDIDMVNMLRPDFIGFIFAGSSRRFVAPDMAAKLRRSLSPSVLPVGVFVNELPENIENLVQNGIIDIVQLHGQETDDYIVSLRKITGKQIIKAFNIASPEDVKKAEVSSADFILLDNGAGGTGKSFDWTLVSKIGRPFFLAGGLAPCNIADALSQTDPYAVDVSSGVESNGAKDFYKIKDFIQAVRGGRK
ncbi:MAG: phosphoribosylanthranilate isomerase [Synergistaceae bacterium]|nr:phosphoribosylanthranilate isomerase [Synergistaceae bacterium]